MGKDLTLTAGDGHKLGAYRADPTGAPNGGIVVVQEIFGVNKHIRELCDGFAADGYVAVAPSLYDRSSERNVQLGYSGDDISKGRALREQFSFLFRQLAVGNTREIVQRHVTAPERPRSGPAALRIKAAADDWDLSD